MSNWRDIRNTADYPSEMSVQDFIRLQAGGSIETDDETAGRTKFNTQQIVDEDNIKFDSKLEREWYGLLLTLQHAGKILNLQLQPAFIIADPVFPMLTQGRFVKPLSYTADFQWEEDGRSIVADVKGYAGKAAKDGVLGAGGLITDAVLLRVRLFLALYGDQYIFRFIIGKPYKHQVWEFDMLEKRQTYYGPDSSILREHRAK